MWAYISKELCVAFCPVSLPLLSNDAMVSTTIREIVNNILFYPDDLMPFVCQRDMCPNAGNAEAAKVCYDHCISVTFASDSPPPLYLCIECANEIHREHPNQRFFDILHPMQQISMVCENKVSLYYICPVLFIFDTLFLFWIIEKNWTKIFW